MTERLILRRWRDSDREPRAAMTADPEVMEFYPRTLDRAASDANIDFLDGNLERFGYGFWALEMQATGQFIGCAGIQDVPFEASFTPAVEIGWQLTRDAWGHGYATEAARGVLAHAFGTLGLSEIVAFAVKTNYRSRAVMERLGMTHNPADDFDRPSIPEGNPHRRHVLYRLKAAEA